MNKKLILVLLMILVASLMVSTASASNKADHVAGIGQMAHPNSSAGMEVCKGCHGDLGSTTTSGFCTGCHSFPVFEAVATATAAVTSTPSVIATSAITVTPTVTSQQMPEETKEIPKEEEEETKEKTQTDEEKESPGFGIVSAMVGLFVLSLLKRNKN